MQQPAGQEVREGRNERRRQRRTGGGSVMISDTTTSWTRGAVRGGGAMKGRGAGRREAVALGEVTRQPAGLEA
jgi:hypothetical protein